MLAGGVWEIRFSWEQAKEREKKNLMLILRTRCEMGREKRKNIKKKNRAWWLLSPTFKFPITFRCLHFFLILFTHLSVLIILIL